VLTYLISTTLSFPIHHKTSRSFTDSLSKESPFQKATIEGFAYQISSMNALQAILSQGLSVSCRRSDLREDCICKIWIRRGSINIEKPLLLNLEA